MRYGVVRLAFILIFGKDWGGCSVVSFKEIFLYILPPLYSLLWLWLCHLCTLRWRGCTACPGGCQLGSSFICRPPGWRCGWTHHWTARVEELRAEAARAAALVDRTGHLHGPGGLRCGLQYTQRGDPLQYARGEDTLHWDILQWLPGLTRHQLEIYWINSFFCFFFGFVEVFCYLVYRFATGGQWDNWIIKCISSWDRIVSFIVFVSSFTGVQYALNRHDRCVFVSVLYSVLLYCKLCRQSIWTVDAIASKLRVKGTDWLLIYRCIYRKCSELISLYKLLNFWCSRDSKFANHTIKDFIA